MAKLYFRYGAMGSGKTAHLLQTAYNYQERGMITFIIKPKIDSKGGEEIVSRTGLRRRVNLLVDRNSKNIFSFVERKYIEESNIRCVLVDEVQFFTRAQIGQLFSITILLDIPVICYGLRTDFRLEGFEGSTRLLQLAHTIEELKTVCDCGRKATINGRMVNGSLVNEGEQVVIDGADDAIEYKSFCPQCYFKNLKKIGG